MKRHSATTIFIFLLTVFSLNANSDVISLKSLKVSARIKKAINKGKLVVESSAANLESKRQSLKFSASGLHSKNCSIALSKLSQYENFKKFIGFIKESKFDKKRNRLFLLLEADLLPFKMTLDFNIPRIEEPGRYPFRFDSGFLKGLLGEMNVSEAKGRCFFHLKADWQGPHTSIGPTMLEFFTTTLMKGAMNRMFQISQTR